MSLTQGESKLSTAEAAILERKLQALRQRILDFQDRAAGHLRASGEGEKQIVDLVVISNRFLGVVTEISNGTRGGGFFSAHSTADAEELIGRVELFCLIAEDCVSANFGCLATA